MEPLFEGHLKLMCLSSIAPQVRGSSTSLWVFATSQPMNIQRISSECSACITCIRCWSIAPRTCSASFWHVHLCVEFSAQHVCSKSCAELDAWKQMVTNEKRWCRSLNEWV